jgi:MFS family permease
MAEVVVSHLSAEEQVERNYRWNFTFNVLDSASFWFGMSFISTAVILPLFVSNFTSNPILIGMIPFLATAGALLPQLFMANTVERAPVKKFFPMVVGFFTERLPIFLLAPVTYYLAVNQPQAALAAFFFLFTWHAFGAGVIIIGWQDMIAKIIPVEKRGRFFGIANFIGNFAGIFGAMAVMFVLQRSDFPNGYIMAFVAASVMVFISWIFLVLVREPAVFSRKPVVSQAEYLRSLPSVLRKDHNFSNYLFSQVIFAISGMATGFLVVYAVQTWQMGDARASGFTLAMQIGLSVANLFFGFLADRKGHKLSLEICFLLSIISLGLAVVAPSAIWFFLIFFLRGAVMGGTFVSGISIVYEFTDPDNRPTYIGLSNTIPGIAGAVAPLIGGLLVGAVSYQAMFILSTAAALVAWVLLRFTVREPRKG